ncbi:MAG: hypothetical protein ACK8QZ_08935, partial [Anaerolineales bacterium]
SRESRSEVAGIATETHIWDLQRLKAIYGSSREREVVEIDLSNFGSTGIPCINASSADGIQSYLCTIDGNLLADLFDLYRSRLLEGNVRSFLGMKGGGQQGNSCNHSRYAGPFLRLQQRDCCYCGICAV